ncbi:MAG: hemerythrin domain-containing protein, partial [Myxococcota bacterium]
SDHPRYPTQTLLLGAHKNFRMISDVLVRRAEQGGDAAAIALLFLRWKMAMKSHEAYEENKLYPYLEWRWPLSCASLRDGHGELHACEQRVMAAAQEGRGAASAALAEALRVHDAVLNAHLDLEEEIVIPALLALSPEEFQTYYDSDLDTLLQGDATSSA